MAHEILDNSYYIERTNRTTGPAWHELVEPFDEDLKLTVVEGAQKSKADQIVVVKSKDINTVTLPNGDVAIISDSGYSKLIRMPIPSDPFPRVLGEPVKDSYNFITVTDMAAMLDRVAITERWPLETMGVLGKGERVFVSFRGDMLAIRGPIGTKATDDIQTYFFVVNYTDGMHATTAGWTGVRIVCANTLRMALQAMQAGVKLIHNASVGQMLEIYVQLLAGLQTAQQRSKETIEVLSMYKATDDEVRQVINTAYPTKDPRSGNHGVFQDLVANIEGDHKLILGSLDDLGKENILALAKRAKEDADAKEALIEAQNKRAQSLRDFTWTLYQRERQDFPEMGGLHLGLQAVIETEDWLRSKRADQIKHVMETTFDGDGISTKTRAARKALALAGVEDVR